MSENTIIVRLRNQQEVVGHSDPKGFQFQRVSGYIGVSDFIQLFEKALNGVNPRNATRNRVVKDILETLEYSPELFWIMSKGIMVSTFCCKKLERNRYRITLKNEDLEGIMDGGHTAFAVANYIVSKIYGEKVGKSIKEWSKCKSFWSDNFDEITGAAAGNQAFNFLVPIEIIAPLNKFMEGVDEDTISRSEESFKANFASICSARNTNVQLPTAALSNYKGLYSYLEENVIRNQIKVVWRSGEGDGCKVEDVIAMACIPLIFLQENSFMEMPESLSKIAVYAQKGKFVTFYEIVLWDSSFSCKEGNEYVLFNETIMSALDMTMDIIRFWDKLYMMFQEIYNKAGGSFGNIKACKLPKSKSEKPKCSKPRFGVNPDAALEGAIIPDGFIAPFVCGVTSLMTYNPTTRRVGWLNNANPANFDLADFVNAKGSGSPAKGYVDVIKAFDWNPQTVGKMDLSYSMAGTIMENVYRMRNNLQ